MNNLIPGSDTMTDSRNQRSILNHVRQARVIFAIYEPRLQQMKHQLYTVHHVSEYVQYPVFIRYSVSETKPISILHRCGQPPIIRSQIYAKVTTITSYKKLSYRRETARQLQMTTWADQLTSMITLGGSRHRSRQNRRGCVTF